MLIGLVGRLKNGKSSAASRLVMQHGYEMLKFAGPLKAALRAMGLNDEMIEGKLKETPLDMLCGKSPRWAMQSLGTDWGRKCMGEDLWVRLWQYKAQALLDNNQRVVCDDVRFLNEARAIREMGGLLIRVTRPGYDSSSTHASETELLSIETEMVLENDSTLDQLDRSVDAIVNYLAEYDIKKMKMLSLIAKEIGQ